MQMRKLGRSSLEISVVGYGAWEAGGSMWGDDAGDEQTKEAMLSAIDAGINWIDTAESYGDGRSEELVGQVLKLRPDTKVFTKVAPFVSGTRADQVRQAVYGSLKRLDVDRIDLYQVHWPDEDNVPVEETWGAMAELQDEGLVGAIGVSNFDRGLIERCLGIRHVDSVQNQMSLLHYEDAAELLPWLSEQGVGYLAYGPLAFGLLTGKIDENTEFHADDWRSGQKWQLNYYEELFAPGKLATSIKRVNSLRPLAERLGAELSNLALRSVIDTPGVTAAIAGSRNPKHVKSNAEVGSWELSPKELEEAVTLSSI